MWTIGKEIDFCYGHRVWSQELNAEYSIDSCTKCRHLHGHQGKIIVELQDVDLKNGMVTDFKHLNWFKKFVDDHLDHKFIIDKNDPLFNHLFSDYHWETEAWFDTIFEARAGGFWTPKLEHLSNKNVPLAVYELYEGLVVVPFVPTSENLSKWLFDIVHEKMLKIRVSVKAIQFNETPKSKSVYSV